MKDLLYLVHRIPYPPNKGDKIRSFHLLSALAEQYRVHLGTFVDSKVDLQYTESLRPYCASLCAVSIRPLWRKIFSLRGLLSGNPLSDTYYADRELAAWCERILMEKQVERIVVFSSSMAQFVLNLTGPAVRRIIDFCDIDSDKWRQFAATHRGPLGWVYGREARLLERLERRIAKNFDVSIFVSEREAAAFRDIAPESASRVRAIRNGVDLSYFDPDKVQDRPPHCGEPYAVFTGAMDYWANVEGVHWFVHEIWPAVRAAVPKAKFVIVGSNPSERVTSLASQPGVVVTGSVPDVRPYLVHAHVAVAPLRIARGVQNKVLEAMAMRRMVVATSAAVQGIDARPPDDVLVTDTPDEFATLVTSRLQVEQGCTSDTNRAYVADRFAWSHNLEAFLDLVEGRPQISAAAG